MPSLAAWRPLACVALFVMLPLGVEAVPRLLRAPKPFDLPPRVPLDARTANLSLLIVVGAPGFGLSCSMPSYCDGLRRIDGAKSDWRPGTLLEPLKSLALNAGWPLSSPCVARVGFRGTYLAFVTAEIDSCSTKAFDVVDAADLVDGEASAITIIVEIVK